MLLKTRLDIINLAVLMGLKKRAVELGPKDRDFANEMLHHWNGRKLYRIGEELDRFPTSVNIWENVYEAGELFDDGSVDFIYIHEPTRNLIASWWDSVRPEGILCGHGELDMAEEFGYTHEIRPIVTEDGEDWVLVHP